MHKTIDLSHTKKDFHIISLLNFHFFDLGLKSCLKTPGLPSHAKYVVALFNTKNT